MNGKATKRNNATENLPPEVQEAVKKAQNGEAPQHIDPTAAAAAAKKQRIGELIAGKVEPPNEFAAYVVSQLRETMGAGRVLANQIKKTRMSLDQMEQESLRLEGAADQHLRDLERWDKPLATTPPAGEDPPVEDSSNEKPPLAE